MEAYADFLRYFPQTTTYEGYVSRSAIYKCNLDMEDKFEMADSKDLRYGEKYNFQFLSDNSISRPGFNIKFIESKLSLLSKH